MLGDVLLALGKRGLVKQLDFLAYPKGLRVKGQGFRSLGARVSGFRV